MREVLHSRCREQIAAFLGNCPCCQARFSFTVCCTALTLRTIKTESPAAGFFENIGVTRSLSRLELRGGAIGRNEPSRLSLYIDAVNFNLAPAGGKRRRILLPIVFGNSLCRKCRCFSHPPTDSITEDSGWGSRLARCNDKWSSRQLRREHLASSLRRC